MTLSRRLNLSFLSILLASLFATAWSLLALERTHNSNHRTSASLLPFVQQTQAFEGEVLNARIAFIYFATIQKPNSLEKGWARYHNAEAALRSLQTMVADDPALALLRPRVQELGESKADYDVHLAQILDLVKQGRAEGPSYTLAIADWANSGDHLVNRARDLENSAATLSQAETANTSFLLYLTIAIVGITQAIGIAVGIILAGSLRRELFTRLGAAMLEPEDSAEALAVPFTAEQPTAPAGSRHPESNVVAALSLISVLAVLFAGFVAFRSNQKLTQAQASVMHAHQVLSDAESLTAFSYEAESNTRAYVFAGNQSSLDLQQVAIERGRKQFDKLARETSATQQSHLHRIQEILQRRFSNLQQTADVRRTLGSDAVRTLLATGEGLSLKQQLQDRISDFEAAENQVLLDNTLAAQREALISKALILFAALPAALFLAISGFVSAHLLRRSIRLQRSLGTLNQTLHTLLQAAPVGIFSIDASGRIGFWNPAAESIFGVDAAQLRGDQPLQSQSALTQLLRRLRISSAASSPQRPEDLIVPWDRPDQPPSQLQISIAPVSGDQRGHEVVAIAQDVTALVTLQQDLIRAAHYDALTGIPNRVMLDERCAEFVAEAQRKDLACAIFAIDLDCFKKVNDQHGHHIGDHYLKAVVARLSDVLRVSDTLVRVGGDEFLGLVQGLREPADAERIAEKLIACLAAPIVVGASQIQASVSVGLAIYPEDGHTADDLRRNADLALYQAKVSGRNRYRRYRKDKSETRRREILAALPDALHNGQLFLNFQPLYAVAGPLRGFEVLLRFLHPELGLVSPAEFIPVAEQSGMIQTLGTWVLEQACLTFVDWIRRGLTPGILSVNVSAAQLTSGNFADTVEQILKRTHLPATQLELELTESMIMENIEDSAREMKRLKHLGVHIAIDDFGTGYSSMSHLHHLPIDTLKIDRSFIQALDHPTSSRPIVESIIALSKTLSLKTVAEGVETEEQRAYLAATGSDFIQGFLFSRPLSIRDAETHLQTPGDQAPHQPTHTLHPESQPDWIPNPHLIPTHA